MPHENNEMDAARKRAKSSRKQIETGGRFKPGEGSHEVRVLETPPDKERDSPALYLEYRVHRNIGPNKRFARCGDDVPSKHKRCWLCKKAAEKEEKGSTKEASNLKPQDMIAVQVAIKDPDLEEMVGPLLWEMSSGKSADAIGYKIRGVISSERRNYTDHKHGYNLHFTRKGTMLKTKWSDIDHDDEQSKVPSGIIKQLKPFVDTGMPVYNEQWQKDAYYGRDEDRSDKSNNSKGEDNMAAKKKSKAVDSDEDVSSSDVSSSNVSSSDASGSDASGSDASSSDSSSSSSDSSSSAAKTKKGKKDKKKSKKEESDSDASSSDSSSSSDASGSDASGSDSSSSSSDASGSDASGSDASGSDASSSGSDASEDDKPKKRKPRADKGKPRKPKKVKKTKKRS